MKRNWDFYVQQGRDAWAYGCTEHPKGGWQQRAWKEGFDEAYERDRPSLDLDHQEQVATRRSQIRLVVNNTKPKRTKKA